MSKLSADAQKLFDFLPGDGSKVGGITLQRELNLSKAMYQRVRDELKEAGLTVSGQGRGGSLARIVGKEPTIGPTKAERLEHAREVKQERHREKKATLELRLKIVDYFHNLGHKQVEVKHVTFYEGRPMIEVWNGPSARVYTLSELAFSQLQAEQR